MEIRDRNDGGERMVYFRSSAERELISSKSS